MNHRYAIPATALVAILPLLIHGPTCGHDFDFHLLSWLEAATQYAHGQYPHWAFTPAFNAGEPRFLFYPPISWTLGALLTLLLPIQYAGTAFTFIALTLSGFTAHRLARAFGTPNPTLCAILYMANPYMLFTAYERSAFAELLAAAFLPLLFQAALTPARTPRLQIAALALPIALIWLTNAPAGVMACYALAILTLTQLGDALWRPATTRAPSIAPSAMGGTTTTTALTTLAGTTLGLALPAFYLVPAAYERKYVQIAMATIDSMRPEDHTLFHHMPTQSADDLFHNAVVLTASLIACGLLATIATLFALLRPPTERSAAQSKDLHSLPVERTSQPTGTHYSLPTTNDQLAPLALLTVLIAFLLTRASLPLWHHVPELSFLQFPWRLTALLAVTLLTLAAQITRPLPTLLTPILAVALTLPAWAAFHEYCVPTQTPEARAALFHSPAGSEPTDEYTPTTADNDALKPGNPPYWLANTPESPAPSAEPGQPPTHLTLASPTPKFLILNRRQFPDWTLTLNGQAPATLPRDDGLIAFALPAGLDTIDLRYHRLPDQTLGLILSILALATLLSLVNPLKLTQRPYSKHSKADTSRK